MRMCLVTHCSSSIVTNYFLMSTSSSSPSLIYFSPSRIYWFWYLNKMEQKLFSFGSKSMMSF